MYGRAATMAAASLLSASVMDEPASAGPAPSFDDASAGAVASEPEEPHPIDAKATLQAKRRRAFMRRTLAVRTRRAPRNAPADQQRNNTARARIGAREERSRAPSATDRDYGAIGEHTPASKHPIGMQAEIGLPTGAVQQLSSPQSVSCEQPTRRQKFPPCAERSLEHWRLVLE